MFLSTIKTINTLKLYRRKSERREYIRGTGKISVIVHHSACDKLTNDSLILLVFGLNFTPPKREKECLANCFQSKICE